MIRHFKKIVWMCLFLFSVFLHFYWPFCTYALAKFSFAYEFLVDRSSVETFILAAEWRAPFVFMVLQVLQVVFAPIPGEITGFVGGYVFGAVLGFLYSSISLTIGSWLIFCIGRFLGREYAELVIPPSTLIKIKQLINERGLFAVFFCYAFPGFPKDYLCLFLGVADMPTKRFLLLTGLGRMPGTLLLSLQGSAVFEENYWLFLTFLSILSLAALISFKYKSYIYAMLSKLD